MRIETAFLFDLDGTLVDSVYQHVLAWKTALDAENIELSVWRIHRKIGMSGGLFTNQLLRETGFAMEPDRIERLRHAHAAVYQKLADQVRPLPGARELLAFLTDAGIPWAIATSGRMETAAVNLAALGVDPKVSAVVTRDEVRYAKPDPDLFLAAAARLDADLGSIVKHDRTLVVWPAALPGSWSRAPSQRPRSSAGKALQP
jgi:beta-phosphoglucomutase-like phosphatase (HAD superfamily)